MYKDLQAAVEIAQTIGDRNYHWLVTQIWDDGNRYFPTISTECSISHYAIKRIEEICDKYDCAFELDFNVPESVRMQIVILEKKR